MDDRRTSQSPTPSSTYSMPLPNTVPNPSPAQQVPMYYHPQPMYYAPMTGPQAMYPQTYGMVMTANGPVMMPIQGMHPQGIHPQHVPHDGQQHFEQPAAQRSYSVQSASAPQLPHVENSQRSPIIMPHAIPSTPQPTAQMQHQPSQPQQLQNQPYQHNQPQQQNEPYRNKPHQPEQLQRQSSPPPLRQPPVQSPQRQDSSSDSTEAPDEPRQPPHECQQQPTRTPLYGSQPSWWGDEDDGEEVPVSEAENHAQRAVDEPPNRRGASHSPPRRAPPCRAAAPMAFTIDMNTSPAKSASKPKDSPRRSAPTAQKSTMFCVADDEAALTDVDKRGKMTARMLARRTMPAVLPPNKQDDYLLDRLLGEGGSQKGEPTVTNEKKCPPVTMANKVRSRRDSDLISDAGTYVLPPKLPAARPPPQRRQCTTTSSTTIVARPSSRGSHRPTSRQSTTGVVDDRTFNRGVPDRASTKSGTKPTWHPAGNQTATNAKFDEWIRRKKYDPRAAAKEKGPGTKNVTSRLFPPKDTKTTSKFLDTRAKSFSHDKVDHEVDVPQNDHDETFTVNETTPTPASSTTPKSTIDASTDVELLLETSSTMAEATRAMALLRACKLSGSMESLVNECDTVNHVEGDNQLVTQMRKIKVTFKAVNRYLDGEALTACRPPSTTSSPRKTAMPRSRSSSRARSPVIKPRK